MADYSNPVNVVNRWLPDGLEHYSQWQGRSLQFPQGGLDSIILLMSRGEGWTASTGHRSLIKEIKVIEVNGLRPNATRSYNIDEIRAVVKAWDEWVAQVPDFEVHPQR